MTFAAVVFVLTSGCAWRHLPPVFAVSPATAHRRFVAWTEAGLWRRLHQRVLDELGAGGQVDWSPAICDAASVRAKRGGTLTGANPVDRGKPGSKLHVLSDRAGPLLAVSAANTHDSQALQLLVRAIPAIRSRHSPRRRPAKLHADKGYDYPTLRRWLRQWGITPRIARRGIDSSTRLGCHHWRIEPLLAQLFGYRRLTTRYERRADLYCGFLTLAAALTHYKRLATGDTL